MCEINIDYLFTDTLSQKKWTWKQIGWALLINSEQNVFLCKSRNDNKFFKFEKPSTKKYVMFPPCEDPI